MSSVFYRSKKAGSLALKRFDEKFSIENSVSDFATHAEPIRGTRNYRENLFLKTVEGNSLIDKAYQMVCVA